MTQRWIVWPSFSAWAAWWSEPQGIRPAPFSVVGGGKRTKAAVDLEGVSAYEAAGQVGLVELLGDEVRSQRPHVTVDAFVKRTE